MYAVNQFSISQLLILGTTLVLLYIVLRFTARLLKRAHFLGSFHIPLKKIIHIVLLVYEPIALLLILTVFLLINVVFHGALVLLVLVFGFNHIKNYVSGQIIKFDQSFTVGKQLKHLQTQGIIAHIGNFGLKIKTNKGLRFIDFSNLIKEGYLLLSGEEIGGYYQLRIEPPEESEKEYEDFQIHLLDLLSTAPYLDWNHKPEIIPSENPSLQVHVKILVKEETHLYDLIALIKGWGYSCKIINS